MTSRTSMVTWSPTNSLSMNFRMASTPQISRRLSFTNASAEKVLTMRSMSKALTAAMCSATIGGSSVMTLLGEGWLGMVSLPSRCAGSVSDLRASPCGRVNSFSRLDSPVEGDCTFVVMTPTLAIGDFSRATHLGVKTLRHYHEIGLLEPVDVDPATGYRRYAPDQIRTPR